MPAAAAAADPSSGATRPPRGENNVCQKCNLMLLGIDANTSLKEGFYIVVLLDLVLKP